MTAFLPPHLPGILAIAEMLLNATNPSFKNIQPSVFLDGLENATGLLFSSALNKLSSGQEHSSAPWKRIDSAKPFKCSRPRCTVDTLEQLSRPAWIKSPQNCIQFWGDLVQPRQDIWSWPVLEKFVAHVLSIFQYAERFSRYVPRICDQKSHAAKYSGRL